MEAAVTGSIECVRYLLKHNAGVHNQCSLDQTGPSITDPFSCSDDCFLFHCPSVRVFECSSACADTLSSAALMLWVTPQRC